MINNSKSISLLVSPLQKIQAATEATASTLFQMHQVVISLNTSAIETVKQLKAQTVILSDIRSLIKQQVKSSSNDSKGGKGGKGGGLGKGLAGAGVAIIIMAASVVVASGLLGMIAVVTPAQILSAILIAGVFLLLAPVFSKISKALMGDPLFGKGKKTKASDITSGSPMKVAGQTALAMAGMAAGIALTSWILRLVAPVALWQIGTAFLLGVAMIPISFAFVLLMKGFARAKIEMNKKGIGKLIMTGLAMAVMAAGIVAIAYIFEAFPSAPAAPPLLWTIQAGLAIALFAIGFSFILKSIKGASIKDLIFAGLAIPVIGIALSALAYIWETFPTAIAAPDLMWVLKVAIALTLFAIPFYLISRAIDGMNAKQLLFMTLAIPIVAFGILATAWIFQGLAGITWEAPEIGWTVDAGLAVLAFGIILFLAGKTIGKMSLGDMLKALIGTVVSAFAVVAVAWIFTLLPGTFIAPPLDWTTNAGAALGVMGLAIVAMGIAVTAMTPVTLLLGALGIIITAVVILAVGWIFAGLSPIMPSLVTVSEGFTTTLMTPMNAMVDLFARFKNEIGVDNMLDLAIGIAALGGAWFLFTLSLAGGSAVGGFASIVSGVADAIGSIWNAATGQEKKKAPDTPIEILQKLANIAPKVKLLAGPIEKVGIAFQKMSSSQVGAIKGFEAIKSFYFSMDNVRLAEQGELVAKIGDSYTKIANASKRVNIKAVDATTNMFKALNDLAKNNGESAMQVLADQLLMAVEKLAATVNHLETAVDSQGSTTSSYTDSISKAVDTVKTTLMGVQKNATSINNDTKEAAMDLQPLVLAIQALEERFDRSIEIVDVTPVELK